MKIAKLPILAFLFVLILVSGCSREAKKNRHLERAQGYFKAQQFDKAEIEFLNALRIDPTNALAIRSLGLGYFDQGRLLQAFVFLQRAFEMDTNNAEIRLRLGSLHLAGHKFKEAREHANAVLLRDPSNDDAFMMLADTAGTPKDSEDVRQRLEALRPQVGNRPGFLLASGSLAFRQQKTNEAMAAFEQALALDPKSSAAHFAMGNLQWFLKDLPRAEQHFKTASDLAPLHSSRRLQYPDFKIKTGDIQTARLFLEDMVKRAPDLIPSYLKLAEIAFLERKFDDAAALCRKVLARDNVNYDAMLLLARVSLAKGEHAKALPSFERIVAAYPRVPQAHYQLAVAQLLNKNPVKAVGSLQQAITLDPKLAEAQLLLAELNIRKGDLSRAIAALRQLIKEQPQIVQAHLLLASAYRSQKQFEDAAAVYRQLIQAFPSDPQPHFLLGQMLLQQRRNAEARPELEKALQIKPNYLPAFDDLIDLDIAESKFAAAHQRVQAHLAVHTNSPNLLLQQAKIYLAQKEPDKAEGALKKAIQFDPNFHAAYHALTRIYVAGKKHQQALEHLNAIVAKSTNDITALYQIGAIHTELKDYPAARDTYEKILAINPRYPPALNNLACIYSEHINRLDRAYDLARTAREVFPLDPYVADTFGWILFKRGEYPWALSLIQESAEKLQKEPAVLFHLGMAHYMLGEEKPAIIAFQRALELGTDFPGRDEAQWCLSSLSNSPVSLDPKMLPELERQLAAQPGDPILLARLAAAYERNGAFDKAAATCQQALKQNPKNVPATLKLAQLYSERLNQPRKAMALLKDARALAPEDPSLAHTLGRLAFSAGDHRWSASLLQESARKLPGSPEVLYDLAWSEYAVGRVAEAQAAMQSAFNGQLDEPRASLAKTFLNVIAATEHADRDATPLAPALPNPQTYEQVLQKHPDFLPAIFLSGRVQEQQGNAMAARDIYGNILARFPHFSPAQIRLAMLLAASPADLARAYEYALKAREALPDDAEVARTLGIIVYNRREYSRAVQLLKESARKRPNDPELFYYLGMAHFQLKQRNEARQALEPLKTNAQFAAEATRILGQLN